MNVKFCQKIYRALTVMLLMLTACSCGGGGGGGNEEPIGDLSGDWQVSSSSSSPTAGCSETNVFDLHIQQNGNTLNVSDDSGNTFNGTISGDQIRWSGSYPDGQGTTRDNIRGTVSTTCDRITGSSTWSYSETGFSCSGTSTFTAERLSGSTQNCGTGSGKGGSGSSSTETEPNNTISQANSLAVPGSITGSIQGFVVNQQISSGSDVDVFTFSVSGVQTITINLEGVNAGTADMDLAIYATNGVYIDGSSNQGSSETYSSNFVEGTYVIVVIPYDVPNSTSYTLSVSAN